MTRALLALCISVTLTAAADAGTYPVSGKWGQSNSTQQGPIDCAKLRVIAFNGDQRTDSKGGVPAYRNRSVSPAGPSNYKIVDEFTTGQIGNGHVNYTLRQTGTDHIELVMSPGGTIKLQRCK